MNATLKLLGLSALLGVAGCASSPAPASAPAAPMAAADAPPAATTMAALSTAQADRGRSAFMVSCSGCHASDEFREASFKRRWQTRTAGDLFTHISTTMPDDAPGSLAPDKYVDLVAFILRLNGFAASEAGSPLDRAGLAAIRLEPIAGS